MHSALKTLLLGAVLIFVALLLLLVGIPIGIWVPAHLGPGALSPAAWPRAIALGLLMLGTLITAQAVLQRRAHSLIERVTAAKETHSLSPYSTLKTIAAMAMLFGYYLLVRWLGIVLASAVALPALSVLYGERRFRLLIGIGLILPTALYAFFVYVAKIPMPLGVLS